MRRKLRVPILLLLIFLSSAMQAQIKLYGDVSHQGDALSDVVIQVFEADKLLRTVAVNRRGKYETQIPLNKQYLLVYKRRYMFPVRIWVDTRVDKASSDKSFEVPLNMEMFYRFEGMTALLASENIGVISATGEDESTFSFTPNPTAIKQLNDLKDESYHRERNGEDPIPEINTAVISSSPEEKKVVVLEKGEEQEGSTLDHLDPTIDLEEIDSESSRNDRQSERYAIIEEAGEIERRDEVARMAERSGSSSAQGEAHDSFIYSSKVVRSQQLTEEQDEMRSRVNAKVLKQDAAMAALSHINKNGYTTRTSSDRQDAFEIIRFTEDNGWVSDEETILVRLNDELLKYRKVNYDLVLADWSYYYMNELEISQDDYERIRSMVNQ